MPKKKTIKIKKDALQPESVELLAKSIIQVSEAFEVIQNSRISQKAIVVLLQEGIGVSKITKTQIKLVLDNLPRLRAWYIKD